MTVKVLLICASALLLQTINACAIDSINAGVLEVTNIGTTTNGLSINNLYGLNGVSNLGASSLGYLGTSNLGSSSLGYTGAGIGGLGLGGYSAQSGGLLPVTYASNIGPCGISVTSDNYIQGNVEVIGTLPFVSAVAFEGNLPSSGAAGVQYSCGNGNVGIVSEGLGVAGSAYGAGLSGAGIGSGIGGIGLINQGYGGCGCGY